MNHTVYLIERIGELSFTFVSTNIDGTNPVTKMVMYTPFIRLGRMFYNLEFGDYNNEIDDIDDVVVTDNGDMRKVLKTVVSTLDKFFEDFPAELVHIDGSNAVRIAYYHKLIRDYYNYIVPHFKVEGHASNGFESFSTQTQYDFIVISKR